MISTKRGRAGTPQTSTPGSAIRILTSTKLAIGLIVYLVAASIAATLVARWNRRFFTSFAFLLPAAALFINLGACSIRRFVREIRRPHRRRHGPDVLHLGLMLLMAGAVVSYQGKRTGTVSLAPGESATLPDGSTLTVTDFRFERYADGRPRDWVSVLRIDEAGRTRLDGFELRVNRPLRRSGYTYYQSSYGEAWQLALRDQAGMERIVHEGERAEIEDAIVLFMGPETVDGSATGRAVARVGGSDDAVVVRAGPGDPLGGATVADVRRVLTTGIEAVADPGWPVVAAALVLVAIGTAVTFVQKLREAA